MTQLLVVRILLIGIGSILFLMLAVLLTRTIQFIRRSSRTTGKIKELILSNRRKKLVRPIIEFNLP